MYYIADGNRPKGPFAQDDLVANGLGRDTLVWREGLPDWLPAHQLETLAAVVATIPPPVPRPAAPPPLPSNSRPRVGQVDPARRRAGTADRSPRDHGPTFFMDCWYRYLTAAIALGVFTLALVGSSDLALFMFLVLYVTTSVFSSILLYGLWELIQDGEARTTPGKAVGFLFIPFFNIYWTNIAIAGLAEEYNRFAERRGIAITPISVILGRLASNTIIPVFIPFVGLLTLIPRLVYLRLVAAAADQCYDEGH